MDTPILLEGSNLGERRRHFNHLVATILKKNADITEIIHAQETTPIDRLCKIDIASKHRHVKYILHNLKDDDMLYVSCALKSHWLLEPQYLDIINPQHLEDEVFPHMIQPAVTKMRHWLQKNLTDKLRCQEFYDYYKDRPEIAIKFLWHCSPDYIMAEMKNVLHKLSPQDLKVLCESCSLAAIIYFEGLQSNKEALSRYIKSEQAYFKSIQCVLKSSPYLYLDVAEKFFNIQKFVRLSPEATRYIMKNHKDRFNTKPELYTVHFLNTKTLASFLTSEEAKALILQIAQAEYLESWFTYKNVEPLILKVKVNERASLKKQIFVDKNVGDKVKEWKYPIPIKLEPEIIRDRNIFKDRDTKQICFERPLGLRMLKKRKYCGNWDCIQQKSSLDLLFDKYRFKNFNNAFHELTEKLLREGTIEGRMNIFLVLVSKSGGVPEQLAKLLTLLVTKHTNEPSNLRAAVVRSLVKRAMVWRLPDDTWNMMMEFGHDLGLDGSDADLECVEGLHAVVLRHLINDIPLSDAVTRALILKEIPTLKDYKLNIKERTLVGPKIAKILLGNDPNRFLDLLVDYKLNIKHIPDAETILVEKARTDDDLARRLFDRRIGRLFLLKETFKLIYNNESYINALKHDTSVLENGSNFASLVKKERSHHDRYLQTLAIYFNEPNGLAEQHRAKLVDTMKSNPKPWFARSINILSMNDLSNLLKVVDAIDIKEVNKKQLVAAFRATAHKIRPALDVKSVDWQWLGAKAIANKVFICREKDRESYISLLLQWRRTARIAIRLGLGSKSKETFIAASKLRPAVALKMATKTYLRNKTIDPQVWEIIKKLIKDLVTDKSSKYLLKSLKSDHNLPDNIKSEYLLLMYEVFLKIDKRDATNILCRVENVLPYVDNTVIRNIIEKYLEEKFIFDNILPDDSDNTKIHALHLRVMVKYLLACTSDIEQKERLDNICDVFFDKAAELNATLEGEAKNEFYGLLYEVIRALKYNKVFLENYVCSLPVLDRISENMKKILPMEQYFALYLEIRIIMLYYNALKESIKERPDIFDNLAKYLEDAIEVVGVNFGEKMDVDINELAVEYFFSIVDVYKNVLVVFLHNFEYEEGQNPIVLPMLKGLFSKRRTQSLVLAQHVFSREECPIDHKDKTLDTLKSYNDAIVNMLVYADK